MTVLCFAIWCKMQHSNSVMFDMGTRQLMSSLRIGQPKVQLLLNAIKTDELFSVQNDGRFIVTSFKDSTRKRNRYGRAFKGAKMFTLEVNKEYTLKDIYNRLNELLFCFRSVVKNRTAHTLVVEKLTRLACVGPNSLRSNNSRLELECRMVL